MMSSTAAVDAAGEILGAEARQDGVLDDQPRHRVGELAFEAVADLDPHPPLVRRDDQHRAGVLALLADAPVPPELIAVVLDRGALQRLQGDDHELAGGLGFEVGELLVRARVLRRPASRMPASSTTRPVSCGKVSACAPARRRRTPGGGGRRTAPTRKRKKG